MLRKNSGEKGISMAFHSHRRVVPSSAMPGLDLDRKEWETGAFYQKIDLVPLRTPLDYSNVTPSSKKSSSMLQISLPSPGHCPPCNFLFLFFSSTLTCPVCCSFRLNFLANKLIAVSGTNGFVPHLCQLAIYFLIGAS